MFEFRLPDVGEGVAEGEIVAWRVEPGDEVSEDQVIAEVETDKAVVDLPSPVAGTVETRHAEVGDVVLVGDVVVTIDPADDAGGGDAPGEPPVADAPRDADANVDESVEDAGDGMAGGSEESGVAASEEAPTAEASDRVFAAPSVRRRARDLGVDVRAVAGSGSGGRVTAADVRDAAGASGAADADAADAITEVASEGDVGGEGAESGPQPESAIRRRDGGEGQAGAPSPAGTVSAERDRTLAVPATRRLADELGVDLDAVPTERTRDGEPFVEPADVEAHAEAQRAAQRADAEAVAAAEPAGEEPTARQPAEGERETREPYRGVRRSIGEKMAESAYTAPHVTHHDRAVVASLVEAREAMKPRAEERGIALTYLPFVLKAVVAGLREYPVLNTSLDEEAEEVVYKHHYDVGVATATDAGLLVPVVRAVDEKGLLQLASEINELTGRARERSIAAGEMRGGTFTVTNFGAIGGEYATPIVNYPETAILGLGAIERRPVVVEGGTASSGTASGATASDEVAARHTLPLSLSIDHRVIDGAEAARFVNTVVEYLESPSLLLLE